MKNLNFAHSVRSPFLTFATCARVSRFVIDSDILGSVAALFPRLSKGVSTRPTVLVDSATFCLLRVNAYNDFVLFRLGKLLNILKIVASSSSGRSCSESCITCQLWTTSDGSKRPRELLAWTFNMIPRRSACRFLTECCLDREPFVP